MQKPPSCRCCLAVDGKLASIHDADAAQLYLDAVGLPVDSTDHFPQYVCEFCLGTLRACARFRARCHKVLELLFQTRLHGNQITKEYTRSLTSNYQEFKPEYIQTQILDVLGVVTIDEQNINSLEPEAPIECKVEECKNIDVVEEVLEPKEEEVKDILYVEEEEEDDSQYVSEKDDSQYVSEKEYLDDFDSFSDNFDEVKSETKNSVKNITQAKKVNVVTKVVTSEEHLNDFSLADKEKSETRNSEKKIEKAKKRNDVTKSVTPKFNSETKFTNKQVMLDYAKSMGFCLTELSLDEQIQEIEEKKKEPGLVCELCGKRSNNSRSFERHKRYHVLKPKHFMCDLCSRVFEKKSSFIEHMLSHRYMLNCKSCDFKTKNNNIMKAHHEFHKGKLYPCKYCDKVFMKPTSLCGHTKAKHDSELPWCDLCGEGFSSEKGVISHKNLSHNIRDDYQYTCACSKGFRSEAALDRHLKVEGCDQPSCVQCGEAFPDDRLLKHHLVQRHIDGGVPATFDCSNCIFRFYNSAALLRHACGARAACAQCGDTFTAPQLLIDHISKAHHIFKCEECSQQFTCSQFKSHYLLKHSELRPTPPPRPRGRARLLTGEIESRLGVRKWRLVGDGIVRECQPRRPREPAIMTHMCEVCGKGFANRKQLSLHKWNMHKHQHRCALCPKLFVSKQRLENHMRVHTGERPYPCSQCPKAFKHRGAYTRHYLIHTGQRDHVCSMCDKTFQTSTAAKMHIKTVHMHMPWPTRARRNRNDNKNKL